MEFKKICCLFWLIASAFSISLSAADGDERRWKKPGIPHRGWIHEGVEDLGEAEGVCEMCDKTHIRYMHTVSHDDHDDLIVGCVCAEKMTQDYINPRAREQVAKKEAARVRQAQRRQAERHQQRQDSWLHLEQWIKKSNGNYSKSLANDWVTIFYKNGTWKYAFNNEYSQAFASADLARGAFVDKYAARIAADL